MWFYIAINNITLVIVPRKTDHSCLVLLIFVQNGGKILFRSGILIGCLISWARGRGNICQEIIGRGAARVNVSNHFVVESAHV